MTEPTPRQTPDLDDPDLLRHADTHHQPEECWTERRLTWVRCRYCQQTWPCATRRAIRALPTDERADYRAALAALRKIQAAVAAFRTECGAM